MMAVMMVRWLWYTKSHYGGRSWDNKYGIGGYDEDDGSCGWSDCGMLKVTVNIKYGGWGWDNNGIVGYHEDDDGSGGVDYVVLMMFMNICWFDMIMVVIW